MDEGNEIPLILKDKAAILANYGTIGTNTNRNGMENIMNLDQFRRNDKVLRSLPRSVKTNGRLVIDDGKGCTGQSKETAVHPNDETMDALPAKVLRMENDLKEWVIP